MSAIDIILLVIFVLDRVISTFQHRRLIDLLGASTPAIESGFEYAYDLARTTEDVVDDQRVIESAKAVGFNVQVSEDGNHIVLTRESN